MVSEPVEDQSKDLAGDSDPGDLSSSSFGDPLEVGRVDVVASGAHRCFDRGPADETGSLFCDPTLDHGGVRLPVPGGEPSPGAELFGTTEPGHISNLGDEHRSQDPTDTGDLLDDLIAGMTGQGLVDVTVEDVDLSVDGGDESSQRVDSKPVGPGQLEPVQQVVTADAEQVVHHHRHPMFGQYGMGLGLARGPLGDQLGPVANQLPQFTRRRRCDPRFGESTQPEEISEIPGVEMIVLTPSVPPRQPRGCAK